jgi:cysteine-rich repeat protein
VATGVLPLMVQSDRCLQGTTLRQYLLCATVAALLACDTSTVPSPTPTPAPAVCGNGVQEAGEECDDGNGSNADGCLTTCQRPVVFTASDVHVHSSGCSAYASPAGLAEQLRTQQIQVGAALVWGEGYAEDSAFFTGHDDPVSTPGFILHYDLEVARFAAARTGHLVLLGLDSLAFSPDVFYIPQSGVPVVEWARRQPRAVVGMAHAQFWPADGSFPVPPGGCCTPFEVVVHAVRGRLDFLSAERMPDEEPGTFRLWKALQNAGFRVAISGASDWSCMADRFHERTPRTDVIVDGPLTYENWLSAIKAGRTALAAGVGNRLNVRVEGRRLGEEVLLDAPQEVTVALETAGRATDVEVLVNGDVAARLQVAEGPQLALVRVPVSSSSWIAARSPNGLTSPVYVLVGGRAVRASADDVCYLWRSVEHLEDLITSRRLYLYESAPESLDACREAIEELQRRFAESGGVSCR